MIDTNRIKALTDEMDHDTKNHGLGEKELRARLRYYRRQIIDVAKNNDQP